MSSESKKGGAAFDLKLIARIIRLAKPYNKLLYLALFLTLCLTLLAPIRPILVQYTIDHHIANKDTQGILHFTLLILVHILLQSLTIFAHTYTTNLLGQNVIKDLRMKVYNHVLGLSSRFFDKSKVGTLITRCVSDVETLSNFFSQGFISIVGELAQIITILIIMFISSWQMTLISLAVMPILIFASEIFRRGVRKAFQNVRTEVSNLNAFVQEQIVGMDVVQVFSKEKQEFEKFEKMNARHRDANLKSVFYYAVYFPIVEILSSLALGLIIWWSAGSPSEASAGLIAAFILYINMIFRPIRFIADRFNTMQMGVVSSERIFDLLDDESEKELGGTDRFDTPAGNIAFKNVWFAYTDENFVLQDVSFDIQPGSSLAIVGATGAGKSSIINLITRLYDIQKGSIEINDKPVTDYELQDLRKRIGVVLQDVFLFAGTVRDNVHLRNQEISQTDIENAAKSINALEFVEGLDGGWGYNVMERGASLSVGQRQLISFIRAMAANPDILILDEATSSVDSETEELIQAATKKLMKGRTSVVIAHRLSTVKEADNILVLDKGKVIEYGSHQDLLQANGLYRELFEKQFELT